MEPVKPTKSAHSHPQTRDNPYPYSASQHASRTSPDFANAGPSRTPDGPQAPAFPAMDMAAMVQFMQQYAPAMASPQMSLMMNPQQAAMMQMFPAGFPFAAPQPNPMMQNDPFWLAVQDTMMNKGLFPGQTQPPALPHTHAAYAQPEPMSPVQQQVLPFPPIPQTGSGSAKTKGKQREVTPITKKRRKVSASSFQEAAPKLDKTNGSKTNGSSMGPPSENKIFESPSGPLAFFVQVGGHNRFVLVQSIKVYSIPFHSLVKHLTQKWDMSEKRRHHCYRHKRRGLCYPLPTGWRFEDRQSARDLYRTGTSGRPASSLSAVRARLPGTAHDPRHRAVPVHPGIPQAQANSAIDVAH